MNKSSMFKFILVLVVAAIFVSVASVAWPYVTQVPRPAPMTAIYNIVAQTPLGQNTQRVLGASAGATQTPISISSVGKSISSSVITAAQSKAQQIITTHAARELTKQFSSLPEDQKKEIQAIICEPK
jgi:hypothetical protein